MTIFSDKAAALAILKARIASVSVLKPLAKACSNPKQDAFLYSKLLATEAAVARRLRIFLEPTQVICDDDNNPTFIANLNLAADMPVYFEPAYDYIPADFEPDSWALMSMRQRPVIAYQSVRFCVIGGNNPEWVVPLSWIRPDKKYGQLRLFPSGDFATIPLNAYLLSVLAGGRLLPQIIRITYTAGLTDIADDYPDLLDFIYRATIFSLIRDAFPGGSSSTSIDGMTKSQSFDIAAYGDASKGAIEGEYLQWQSVFNGPRLTVL